MSREPQVGDVIHPNVSGLPYLNHVALEIKVTERTLSFARELVASGRWVVVESEDLSENS